MGAWKFLPEDAHLLDQPEDMIDDLLQWKMITSIVENMKRKKEEAEKNNATTIY
jgi:hypothetical protein